MKENPKRKLIKRCKNDTYDIKNESIFIRTIQTMIFFKKTI